MSSRLCVVDGYNNHGVGDVVAIRNGVPGRTSTIKHTQGMYGVSCPNKSGCIALGRPGNDVGAVFVDINSSGLVTGSKLVKVPPGVTLSSIDCASLRNCMVAGTDFFTTPAGIEVGSWNGRKLRLHLVPVPRSGSLTTVGGISCQGSWCVVAGYVTKGTSSLGLVLTVHNGNPRRLRTVPGDFFYGVACTSSARCYASGFVAHGAGIVVTLNGGVAGSSQHFKSADMFGIACGRTTCTSVGEELAPPSSGNSYWGVIATLTGGKLTATQIDSAVGGFDGFDNVARIGNFFAAVGPAQHGGSEVSTG